MLQLLCLVGFFAIGSDGGSAPFITPCKLDDEACLLSSSQKAIPYITGGIPELGVPKADPLFIGDVNGDQGDLLLKFRNMNVEETSHCKFESVRTQGEKSLFLELYCPIKVTGQYTVGGKLLFIPIEGDGDFEVTTKKIKISLTAKLNSVDGSDGKKHLNVQSLDYTYEPIEKVHFVLHNLFNGDEAKAKPISDVLDEAWKEVILTLGQPIIKEMVHTAKDVINLFFLAVPSDELHL